MYLPALFEEPDRTRIHDVIDRYPFGLLIAVHPDGTPEIAHVPFLLDRGAGPHGTLRFHVARANPIRALLESGAAATAVINGPDAYVSASWYEHPAQQVPTWNYVAVHASGQATRLDRAGLAVLLADLSARHEPDRAWSMDLLAPDFAQGLMTGITGFSLLITRIDAKFKLSQNRSPADHLRVREALDAAGRGDITSWMPGRGGTPE